MFRNRDNSPDPCHACHAHAAVLHVGQVHALSTQQARVILAVCGDQQRATGAMAQHERDDLFLCSLVKTGKRLIKHNEVARERNGTR